LEVAFQICLFLAVHVPESLVGPCSFGGALSRTLSR